MGGDLDNAEQATERLMSCNGGNFPLLLPAQRPSVHERRRWQLKLTSLKLSSNRKDVPKGTQTQSVLTQLLIYFLAQLRFNNSFAKFTP
jgi:hypothetical protein